MTASQDASLVRVPVRPGDILVLATDGLFDNVGEEALLQEPSWNLLGTVL